MTGDDMNSAYYQVLRSAFLIAAETGERCRPVHLLAALAEADGPVAAALRSPDGGSLARVPAGTPPASGTGGGYLMMQAQQAARELASGRGETAGPEHLLLAVVDQSEPEAIALLARAGLDADAVRSAALSVLGAPAGTPAIRMPPPVPAGTHDRPALPEEDLDPRAWEALRWRQEHLPLRRLRRPGHYEALRNLEARAAWRAASRFRLDDDQRYSLYCRHLAQVERRAAEARPGLVPPGGGRPSGRVIAVVPAASNRPRTRHRGLRFTLGWGTWLSNRWTGLRDWWFRLRTMTDYRGAPSA